MRKRLVFQRLPKNLDRRQMLFLDGIRFSVEIAETAYGRLCKTLLTLANSVIQKKKVRIGVLTVRATSDAWAIIDSVYRLCGLLRQMRGVKQNTPSLNLLYREAEKVEALRNTVQHLNNEISNLISKELPVWGTLSWVAIPNPTNDLWYTCSLAPGTVFARQIPIINPVGKEPKPPIDMIELNAIESVNLSKLIEKVDAVISYIEKLIRKQIKGKTQAGADMLLLLVLAPDDQIGKELPVNAQE